MVPRDHWNNKEMKGLDATYKKVANKHDDEERVHEIRQEKYSKVDLEELVVGLEHLDKKGKQ